MFFQKISGLLYILLGAFLLIVVGGMLMLQLLASVFGFMLIVRGCGKLGMCKIKTTMNSFCDL